MIRRVLSPNKVPDVNILQRGAPAPRLAPHHPRRDTVLRCVQESGPAPLAYPLWTGCRSQPTQPRHRVDPVARGAPRRAPARVTPPERARMPLVSVNSSGRRSCAASGHTVRRHRFSTIRLSCLGTTHRCMSVSGSTWRTVNWMRSSRAGCATFLLTAFENPNGCQNGPHARLCPSVHQTDPQSERTQCPTEGTPV